MGNQRRKRQTTVNSTRYRLCVVAHDVGELVDVAGGWICDRILAGWDVSVAISEPCDRHALQILGVTTLVAHEHVESAIDSDTTSSIAVAPGVFEHNDVVRDAVMKALGQADIEVTFCGMSLPSELDGVLTSRQYRVSDAGRAFKAYALAAAAVPSRPIDATEALYSTATCETTQGVWALSAGRGVRNG